MDTSWLRRYRLIGNEDTEVGIECSDHFDGGRPLAFYSGDDKPSYVADPLVQNVTTIQGLLAAAEVHEHEKHGQPTPSVVNVHVTGTTRSEAELAKLVQDAIRNNPLRGR